MGVVILNVCGINCVLYKHMLSASKKQVVGLSTICYTFCEYQKLAGVRSRENIQFIFNVMLLAKSTE